MIESTERILGSLRAGRIGRREAVSRIIGLALASAGAGGLAAAADDDGPTFRARGVDHIALRVTDVARSRDFYREHLGLRVTRDQTPERCFLSCGDDFLALFRGAEASMDHYCYSVEGFEPGAAVATLKARGLAPRRIEDRVYFDDPDGLEVQVSA